MFNRIPFLFGMLIVLVTSAGFSLTLAKASLDELASESAIIVHGEVKSIEYQWEDASQRAINTLVTVDVMEYLKGSDQSEIVVKQMGGKIGDLTDKVDGTPVFQAGEEVILFLVEYHGDYYIHSIVLGSFRVFVDAKNTKRVINDLRNIHLVDPDTGKEVLPKDALTPFRFDAFISKINSLLSQQ